MCSNLGNCKKIDICKRKAGVYDGQMPCICAL